MWAGSESSQTVPELQWWQLQTGPAPADEPGMKQEEPTCRWGISEVKALFKLDLEYSLSKKHKANIKKTQLISSLISKIICILIGKIPYDSHLPLNKQAFEGWAIWPLVGSWWALLYTLPALNKRSVTPVASQTKLLPAPAISNTP